MVYGEISREEAMHRRVEQARKEQFYDRVYKFIREDIPFIFVATVTIVAFSFGVAVMK